MKDSEFEFITRLVYQRSRIRLSDDKRHLVTARLMKRLRGTNTASVTAYCELLRRPDPNPEVVHLIDAMSTNHTFFFRENAHFDFLRETILPDFRVRSSAQRNQPFRVWSAACSSGEEPYTIAMVLSSMLDGPWRIEATDISSRILARAVAAIYPAEAVSRLPADVVKNCFQKGIGPQEGNYRVRPELRQHVAFHQLNLLEGETPFRELFHAIFCRNVMIYFDRVTQEELIDRLSRKLLPGGYLFVGHSESLSHLRHGLRSVRPAIYRKLT